MKVQGRIQQAQDESDRARPASKSESKARPVQAGAARQPGKVPAQHLKKRGNEAELDLEPRFLAQDYRGSGKLDGLTALVTGDSGIGRAVSVLFAREGADVAIVCLDETADAEATRQHVVREGRRCILIKGDVNGGKCASAGLCD